MRLPSTRPPQNTRAMLAFGFHGEDLSSRFVLRGELDVTACAVPFILALNEEAGSKATSFRKNLMTGTLKLVGMLESVDQPLVKLGVSLDQEYVIGEREVGRGGAIGKHKVGPIGTKRLRIPLPCQFAEPLYDRMLLGFRFREFGAPPRAPKDVGKVVEEKIVQTQPASYKNPSTDNVAVSPFRL